AQAPEEAEAVLPGGRGDEVGRVVAGVTEGGRQRERRCRPGLDVRHLDLEALIEALRRRFSLGDADADRVWLALERRFGLEADDEAVPGYVAVLVRLRHGGRGEATEDDGAGRNGKRDGARQPSHVLHSKNSLC